MRNEGQISQRTFIDILGFSYCYLMMLKYARQGWRRILHGPAGARQAWCDKVIMPRLLKCGALEEEGSFFVCRFFGIDSSSV